MVERPNFWPTRDTYLLGNPQLYNLTTKLKYRQFAQYIRFFLVLFLHVLMTLRRNLSFQNTNLAFPYVAFLMIHKVHVVTSRDWKADIVKFAILYVQASLYELYRVELFHTVEISLLMNLQIRWFLMLTRKRFKIF